MTPKEKAFDLVDDMLYGCKECDYQWVAKKCALRAVDEILEQMAYMWLHYANLELQTEEMQQYWQQVKQEIESL